MAKALGRVKIDIVTDETFEPARTGLLKAFLIREGDLDMNRT